MSAKSIPELKQQYGSKNREREVKLELGKIHLDFTAKLIGLVVATCAIVLGAFSIYGLNKLPNGKELGYLYAISVGTGCIFFFLLFYFLYAKKLVYNMSQTHAHLECVLDIFEKLEDILEKNASNLNDNITSAEKTSMYLANAPLSNLISWKQSSILELDADTVMAISIELSWAANKDTLRKIFDDLIHNVTDRYFYIVTSNSEKAEENFAFITAFLKKEINNNEPHLNLSDRFQLKKLHELKLMGIEVFQHRTFLLPIPNDIVIYHDSKKDRKIAVISTDSFPNKSYSENDLHKKYDVKFENVDQVIRIERWFKNTWKALTNEDI